MTVPSWLARRIIAAVIPARNAAPLLMECIEAVRSQSIRIDETWIVVGPSDDGTDAVARRLADASTTVLENSQGDRASAINRVLERSRAACFVLVDAQTRIGRTYVASALAALDRTGAAVVGGPMRPQGRSPVGRAMAAALGSPFGVGDSQFHFPGVAREVDSVYLGVYRASAFERVGRYHTALLRTEDDDMNARIREAGLGIWLDPAIESTYLCRNRISEIWSQYVGYGYWKVALATHRPGALRPRHLGPAAFVVLLTGAAVVSLLAWWAALPLVAVAYVASGLAAAAMAGAREWSTVMLFPVVTLAMHLGYGIGSIVGLARWGHLRRRVARHGGDEA